MHYNNSSNHHYLSEHLPVFVNGSNKDILKHVESLRTRLGFARFKLRNGWEKNSLGDVECFWKQRQRRLIKEIPIPRFTQQDIIDKRSYIPASGARYAKSKKSKYQSRGQPQYKKHVWNDKRSSVYSPESSPLPATNIRNHSISSFDASFVPNDLNGEPSNVENSLDYLSYAIAMTERGHSPTTSQRQDKEDEDTDINLGDDVSPDWTRTSQLRLSLSVPNQMMVEEGDKSTPTSPATATYIAAQAMLMFVKR
ncbi:hypothetical protein FB192DRAFT_1332609 [Mucor lusitanicus]|uniref:Uncharacterized protein n=1 Tax=Mucor circinelloides f. lusitanicus TaxID=29924 RepID=A0A8H4BC81_MUCCL|nr:hypothetical protein FB192DRAFT_1332609 [Mucor lusitanicus]